MEWLVTAMVLGVIPALIASQKGRSAFRWWVYGALLFVIALPHALLLSSRQSSVGTAPVSVSTKGPTDPIVWVYLVLGVLAVIVTVLGLGG